jgi:transposase
MPEKVFRKNGISPTIFCPSSKCFAAAETVGGGTEPLLLTHKIKLNPTRWQKAVLWKMNDHCRYTYNTVLAAKNEDDRLRMMDHAFKKRTKLDLRNEFVTETVEIDGARQKTPFFETRPWLFRNSRQQAYTPNALRQQAISELFGATKSAFSNMRAGNIRKFGIGFRSKRKKSWTIEMDKNMVEFADGKLTILKESLCSTHLDYKPSEEERRRLFRPPKRGATLPDETRMRVFEKPRFMGRSKHFCKIHYDGLGRYFLLVPVDVDITTTAGKSSQPAVGIDPGIRKFAAVYDTEGVSSFVGVREVDELVRMNLRIDALISRVKMSQCPRVRKRLRGKLAATRRSYRDFRDNFHWQTAARLAKSNCAVFMPNPDLKEWAGFQRTNGRRRLSSSGLGEFKIRLGQACAKYGTWFPDVDEHYTTKTCSCCGSLHFDIGSNEVFECPNCGVIVDRDLNAAKNMILKHLEFCEIPPDDAALVAAMVSDACVDVEDAEARKRPLDGPRSMDPPEKRRKL